MEKSLRIRMSGAEARATVMQVRNAMEFKANDIKKQMQREQETEGLGVKARHQAWRTALPCMRAIVEAVDEVQTQQGGTLVITFEIEADEHR